MRKLCIFLLALFPILSIAKNAQDVKTELLTLYPKANITSVKETPIQGLFEIGLGDRIAYVSDSQNTSEDAFRYWIFGGSLFDVKSNRNLTSEALKVLTQVDTKTLDTSLAISRTLGNGRDTLYVFTDPLCPYCKELEKILVTLTDVTIHTFLLALDIHPGSSAVIEEIWTSKNRAKAMEAFFSGKGKISNSQKAQSKFPNQEMKRLTQRISISATPTVIFADGSRITGLPSRETLLQRIQKAKQ